MAAPTVSRVTLRRELARRLSMPFALRVGDYSVFTGTPTATQLYDGVKLVQKSNTWNYQSIYIVDGDEAGSVRRIADFVKEEAALLIEEPLAGAPDAGDAYEIHARWDANQLHRAINHAIDQAFYGFYGVTADETIPVQRDTLQYSLPSDMFRVTRLWIGQQSVLARGTATAGGATTLTDSNAAFPTDGNGLAGQKVSIIWGTGKGQIRTLDSNTANQLTVTAAWTTNPATDSLYVVWEQVRQPYDWLDFTAVRFDRPDYPTTLYLPDRLAAWEGLPLRIEYVYKPPALTSDADTTPVPEGYLLPKAQAYLHGLRAGVGAYADQERHSGEQVKYETIAENYKINEGWRMPQSSIWRGQAFETLQRSVPDEYPF